jgi:hypothetical protein
MVIFNFIVWPKTDPTCRSLGLSAASFEITDRPQFEDFLSGIGFSAQCTWAPVGTTVNDHFKFHHDRSEI